MGHRPFGCRQRLCAIALPVALASFIVSLTEAQDAAEGTVTADTDLMLAPATVAAEARLDLLKTPRLYTLSVSNAQGSTADITKAVFNVEGLRFDSVPWVPGVVVTPAQALAKSDGVYSPSQTVYFAPRLSAGVGIEIANGELNSDETDIAEPSRLSVSITFSNGKVLSGAMVKQAGQSWVFSGAG